MIFHLRILISHQTMKVRDFDRIINFDIYLSIYFYHVSTHLRLFLCLFIHAFIYIFIYLFIYLSIHYLFIYLIIDQFTFLTILQISLSNFIPCSCSLLFFFQSFYFTYFLSFLLSFISFFSILVFQPHFDGEEGLSMRESLLQTL